MIWLTPFAFGYQQFCDIEVYVKRFEEGSVHTVKRFKRWLIEAAATVEHKLGGQDGVTVGGV